MREIKFRAWNKDDNEWLDLDHLAINPDNGALIGALDPDEFYHYDSRNYILMQYTGLKDKNSVGIYEGDLIDITRAGGDRGCVPVVFKDGNFCLYVEYWVNEYYPLNTYDSEHYVVIGNIYEHGHLLENESKE